MILNKILYTTLGLVFIVLLFNFFIENIWDLHYQCVENQEVSKSTVTTSHSSGSPKIKTKVVVMITSFGDNSWAVGRVGRDLVRSTWLSEKDERVKCVFLLGNIDKSRTKLDILKEQDDLQDIIILNDVQDQYETLSPKVLRGLEEVYKQYDFEWVLKADPDSFVILPRLLEFLESYPPNRTYMGSRTCWGYDNGNMAQYVTKTCYMLGGGYLLSSDLVAYFGTTVPLMKRYQSEDVTIGAHLMNLNFKEVDSEYFKTDSYLPCSCSDKFIVNHKCGEGQIYNMFHTRQRTGKICAFNETVPSKTKIDFR